MLHYPIELFKCHNALVNVGRKDSHELFILRYILANIEAGIGRTRHVLAIGIRADVGELVRYLPWTITDNRPVPKVAWKLSVKNAFSYLA